MKKPRVLAVAVILRREARECRQWRVRREMVGPSFRNANHEISVPGLPIRLR
jgi:hypothetical protein